MGYYDTQKAAPNAGGQPYNVRDMLLATQGITGGVDKLVADAGVDRKAQQQMKANAYVSELLGKTTPENYQQQLLQAGAMSPYASPELMNQVKDTRNQIQYDQGVATHASERVQDIEHRDKSFAETVRMNEASIRHQGVVEGQSQQQIDNQVAQMKQNYTLGIAGINVQKEQVNLQKNNYAFQNASTVAGMSDKGYEYKNGKFVFNPDVGSTTDAQGNKQMSPYRYQINLAANKSVSEARGILDPTKMLDARSKKNTFGGLFELDSTTLRPLDRVSSSLGGLIPARDAEAWRQKILADPDAASKALDLLGVPK